MTGMDQALIVGQVVVVALILAGLVIRHRTRSSTVFPAYLLALLAADVILLQWPERVYSLRGWICVEALMAALRIALAVELGARIFRPFPRARATALTVGVVTGAVVALSIGSAAGRVVDLRDVADTLMPRVLYGIMTLYAAILALQVYHLIPLDPLHKAILIGLTPYLLVFTGAVTSLELIGWHARAAANHLNGVAFALVLLYWAVVAWRRDEIAPEDVPILSRLQPWRG